jgi:hypothetical protein
MLAGTAWSTLPESVEVGDQINHPRMITPATTPIPPPTAADDLARRVATNETLGRRISGHLARLTP